MLCVRTGHIIIISFQLPYKYAVYYRYKHILHLSISSDIAAITSDEEETEEDIFEKPGIIENAQAGTICRVLYGFTATSDTMVNVKSGDTVTLVADCLISDTWVYVRAGKWILYTSLYILLLASGFHISSTLFNSATVFDFM